MGIVVTDVGPTAVLELYSNLDVLLVVIPLNNPFGAVSGDVLTLDVSPALSANGIANGTAAKAKIWTLESGGVAVVDGLTVGTSGADIILNSVACSVGQPVTITSGTITHNTGP